MSTNAKRLRKVVEWRFKRPSQDIDPDLELSDFVEEVEPQLAAGESIVLRGYTAIHAAEDLGLDLYLAPNRKLRKVVRINPQEARLLIHHGAADLVWCLVDQ